MPGELSFDPHAGPTGCHRDDPSAVSDLHLPPGLARLEVPSVPPGALADPADRFAMAGQVRGSLFASATAATLWQ